MKNYELLIFDWDGTLIDSVNRILTCFDYCFDELGLPRPDAAAVKPLIGLPLAEAFQVLLPPSTEVGLPECAAIYRRLWRDERIPLSSLFEGVPSLLITLEARSYQLAVATGKSREGLEREQKHHGIDHHFLHTRCALETKPKPDPEMLLELLAEYDVPAERALMIGDTTLDLEMAHNAGIDAVAVTSGSQTREQLMQSEPMVCLSGATYLPDLL